MSVETFRGLEKFERNKDKKEKKKEEEDVFEFESKKEEMSITNVLILISFNIILLSFLYSLVFNNSQEKLKYLFKI